MTDVGGQLRHFVEEVRLRMERSPIEGLARWAELHTELAQGGHFDVCDELLLMIKGLRLPGYGPAIVRYAEGWTLDRSGDWREAVAAYEESLVLFDEQGLGLATHTLAQIGSLFQDQGDWERAEDAYERALAAARDDHARALVLNNLGGLHHLAGRSAPARRCFEEAKAAFAAGNDDMNHAASCVGLGGVLRDENRLTESAEQLVEALMAFRKLRAVKHLGVAVGALALTYHAAGEIAAAVHNYHAALELSRSVRDRSTTAQTLANLALAVAADGDRESAREWTTQALAEYEELGDRHGAELARRNLAALASDTPRNPG